MKVSVFANVVVRSAFVVAILVAVPERAFAVEYFNPTRLIASHFRGVDEITQLRVRPDLLQRKRIEARTGHRLPRSDYAFYVAKTDGVVEGYALLDRERGHREMITFLTFMDSRGVVSRVEVVEYLESLGGAIRTQWYRDQFVGRGPSDRFRPDYDIETPWQAVDSSDAACRAVHRAVVVLDEVLLHRQARVSASGTTTTSPSSLRPWWLSTSSDDVSSRRGSKNARHVALARGR